MTRPRGQSGIETCTLVLATTVALVAMAQYLRFAVAARVKSGADSQGSVLFDPEEGGNTAYLSCRSVAERREGAAGTAVATNDELQVRRSAVAAPVQAARLEDCPS
jgi:hypothetical protein